MAWYTALLELLKKEAADVAGKGVLEAGKDILLDQLPDITKITKGLSEGASAAEKLAAAKEIAGAAKPSGAPSTPAAPSASADTKHKAKATGEVTLAPPVESALTLSSNQLGNLSTEFGAEAGQRSLIPQGGPPVGSAMALDEADSLAQHGLQPAPTGRPQGQNQGIKPFDLAAFRAETAELEGRGPGSLIPAQQGPTASDLARRDLLQGQQPYHQGVPGFIGPDRPQVSAPDLDLSGMGVRNAGSARATQDARTILANAGADPSILDFSNENDMVRALKLIGKQIPLFGAAVPDTQGGSYKKLPLEEILNNPETKAAWDGMTDQQRAYALFDGTTKGAQALSMSQPEWERLMGGSQIKTQGGITSLMETSGLAGKSGLENLAGQLLSAGGGGAGNSSVSGAGGGVAPAAQVTSGAPSLAAGTRAQPRGSFAGGGASGYGGSPATGRPGQSRYTQLSDTNERKDFTVLRDFGGLKAGDPYSASTIQAQEFINRGLIGPAQKDPDARVLVQALNPDTGIFEGPVKQATPRQLRSGAEWTNFAPVGDEVQEGIDSSGKRKFFPRSRILAGESVGAERARNPKFFYDTRVDGQIRALTEEQQLAAPPGTLREVETRTMALTEKDIGRATDYMASLAHFREINELLEPLTPEALSIQGDLAVNVARIAETFGMSQETADLLVKKWTGSETLEDAIELRILLESWVNSKKDEILNDQRISGPDQIRLDRVIQNDNWFADVDSIRSVLRKYEMFGMINNELGLVAAGQKPQFPVFDKESRFNTSLVIQDVAGISVRESGVWIKALMRNPQLMEGALMNEGADLRRQGLLQPAATPTPMYAPLPPEEVLR